MTGRRQFVIDEPQLRSPPLSDRNERSPCRGARHRQSDFLYAGRRRGLHFVAPFRLLAGDSTGARQQVTEFRLIQGRRRCGFRPLQHLLRAFQSIVAHCLWHQALLMRHQSPHV
jgi:hypothetical protein